MEMMHDSAAGHVPHLEKAAATAGHIEAWVKANAGSAVGA